MSAPVPEINEQPSSSFMSIERFVAFILGPIVIAASGTLSAWLSTKVGVEVSSGEIEGAFATGGLAAGAGVWKWLHGRQKTPLLIANAVGQITHLYDTVSNTLVELGVPNTQQETIERTVMGHLEEHANAIVQKLAAHITPTVVNQTFGQPDTPESPVTSAGGPLVEEPIPPAPGDPAPATPIPAQTQQPVAAVPPTASAPPSPTEISTPPAGVGG